MIPKYSCYECGMSSSRRYSVQRHIRLVHNGAGSIVLFQDYIAGRKNSQIKASTLQPRESLLDPESIYNEEFMRELARLNAQIFHKKFQQNSRGSADVEMLEMLREMKFFEGRRIYPGHVKRSGSPGKL
ncbi:MAG: hypothetical protein ABI361_12845 [Nitrososphaera sp.]